MTLLLKKNKTKPGPDDYRLGVTSPGLCPQKARQESTGFGSSVVRGQKEARRRTGGTGMGTQDRVKHCENPGETGESHSYPFM